MMRDLKKCLVKTDRNSSFELLRIIAMVMIVAHHYVLHSEISFDPRETDSIIVFNDFFARFMLNGGKFGVNLFILISGYFLYNDEKLRIDRLLLLWIKTLFYSIGIMLIMLSLNKIEFSFDTFRKTFMPIVNNSWWFISCYFLLYLIHPLINQGVQNIKREYFIVLLIAFFVLWNVSFTIFALSAQHSEFGNMLFVYLIAIYIKKYNIKLKTKPFIVIIFVYFIYAIVAFIGTKYTNLLKTDSKVNHLVYSHGFYILFTMTDIRNIFCLVLPVLLFLTFKEFKPFCNKTINTLGKATLGVYLIHDAIYVRSVLWKEIICGDSFKLTNDFWWKSLLSIIAVFCVCSLIDILYNFSIEKIFVKIIRKTINKIPNLKEI